MIIMYNKITIFGIICILFQIVTIQCAGISKSEPIQKQSIQQQDFFDMWDRKANNFDQLFLDLLNDIRLYKVGLPTRDEVMARYDIVVKKGEIYLSEMPWHEISERVQKARMYMDNRFLEAQADVYEQKSQDLLKQGYEKDSPEVQSARQHATHLRDALSYNDIRSEEMRQIEFFWLVMIAEEYIKLREQYHVV